MDRLISLEPSNIVVIRIEPAGQKCCGELTLRNVMYTMPVAIKLQPMDCARYTVKPQSGIISPLATLTLEITYHLPQGSPLPQTFPQSEDSFLLHSVVAPGTSIKDPTSMLNAVPSDWFTAKKKQVFVDSGLRIMFVGSPVLAQLVRDGSSLDQIREVLERSDTVWKAADSVDSTEGETLLHLAIAQGRADLVQLLLEFEPDVQVPNRSGSTALEAASASGEALIVELLLSRGASIERSDTSALGPTHLAVAKGHLEVLRLLLQKGASVDALTRDGSTPLHLAVAERRRDCVRLLLASGAKPNVHNSEDGDTPLHIAASSGDDNMVKLLIQKGANKYVRNQTGKTPYDLAAENGHVRLFDALRLGDALGLAARKGEVKAMHRLLENGAAINGLDQHGWTALHRVSFKGHADAVKVLIEKGIDIDAKDEDGYTALHCAVESGHMDVIEMLIKKGADVDSRTSKGISPVQIAESLGYPGITRVLTQNGASNEGIGSIKEWRGPVSISSRMAAQREANSGESKMKMQKHRKSTVRGSFDRSAVPLSFL
ncbi:ankyrin-1-like [Punica granatum]|uniref:MSP domain-containing protein n=2 Tax=Punica granatum TaxID=22663 RepID=A0A218WKL4_PUNGR|nr:ankyrin-1-like [Punica granatum]OWM73186.1 hypothetical protein CDL15_Pgr001300 [Punica granatum]PKI69184.1 hypothetical protein CRG98_010451 [Punica granatum]